jgi:hypothetical protein
MQEQPLNPGHYVEACERAFLASKFLETIADHPVFLSNTELKKQWDTVQELVADIYQLAGTLMYYSENAENSPK